MSPVFYYIGNCVRCNQTPPRFASQLIGPNAATLREPAYWRNFYFGGVDLVKVNGEMKDIAGKTVSEYLQTTSFDPKRIAVERNGEIVFKSQYDNTIFADGDTVEVVSFVGGG